tara:strand:- start:2717 stop:2875 length:159 start_codon:yes stop_codon:yes gene_type:complete
LLAGRNVIERLPATELRLHVFGLGSVTGNGAATTIAGQIVATRVQVSMPERR